jgi:DeoR family transcriptional regulator of aga operon
MDETSGTTEPRVPVEQRRAAIINLVRARPFVRVADLAQRFGVSEVTIRADLESLDGEGLIRRVRGGAVWVPQPRREASYVESLGERADEKAAIGATAAALVQPGESVFIDVGTTATALARSLVSREDLEDVVLLTNALPTALELEDAIPRFTVIVIGGTLRPLQHSLVDPLASVLLSQLHIDTAFIGCTGVTVTEGITNVNLPEAGVKRQIVTAARRTIVIADGSKIGSVSLAPVCPIDDIDLLVTGPSAPVDELDRLEAQGLAVDVVEVTA